MENPLKRSASAPACIFDSNSSAILASTTPNPELNPDATRILNEFKLKHADQSLQPEDFWLMMEADTGMGSCFLGEFIGSAEEEDICLVIKYLIKFGQNDKDKLYECMTGYTGNAGITPLNELIRRMPKVSSEDSEICKLFSDLLDLIKTLEPSKISLILRQKDLLYGTMQPAEIAQQLGKRYIADAILDILLKVILPLTPAGSPIWSPYGSPEGRFVDQPSEKF